MKKLIAVLCLFAGVACAATDQKTKTASAKAPAKPATVQILTVPKGTVHQADGGWTWTDKKGAKWVYHETPFGVVRSPWQEKQAEAVPVQPAAEPPAAATRAVETGDVVKFERPTPFGPVKWEKKKSELTDDERRILDAQNAKPEQK